MLRKLFTPVVIGVCLLASACGESEPTAVPTLQLTTTTSTTEPPTTAPPATDPTTAPTSSSTSAPAAAQEKFDPDTAQAEIAALIDAYEELWNSQVDKISDSSDPRIKSVYTGEQLDLLIEFFDEISVPGKTVEGELRLRRSPPAILYERGQTAVITGCRLNGLALLGPDGTIEEVADSVAFEYAFEFAFVDGTWRISAHGKPDGEEFPCDL